MNILEPSLAKSMLPENVRVGDLKKFSSFSLKVKTDVRLV